MVVDQPQDQVEQRLLHRESPGTIGVEAKGVVAGSCAADERISDSAAGGVRMLEPAVERVDEATKRSYSLAAASCAASFETASISE